MIIVYARVNFIKFLFIYLLCGSLKYMGLTHMPTKTFELDSQSNLRCLNLAVRQIQDSMGLARIPDPRCLDLAVSQIQDNDHPPLSCARK